MTIFPAEHLGGLAGVERVAAPRKFGLLMSIRPARTQRAFRAASARVTSLEARVPVAAPSGSRRHSWISTALPGRGKPSVSFMSVISAVARHPAPTRSHPGYGARVVAHRGSSNMKAPLPTFYVENPASPRAGGPQFLDKDGRV